MIRGFVHSVQRMDGIGRGDDPLPLLILGSSRFPDSSFDVLFDDQRQSTIRQPVDTAGCIASRLLGDRDNRRFDDPPDHGASSITPTISRQNRLVELLGCFKAGCVGSMDFREFVSSFVQSLRTLRLICELKSKTFLHSIARERTHSSISSLGVRRHNSPFPLAQQSLFLFTNHLSNPL